MASLVLLLFVALLGKWRGVALETDGVTLGLGLWLLGVGLVWARTFARFRSRAVWTVGAAGPALLLVALAVVAVKRHIALQHVLLLAVFVGLLAVVSWLVGNLLLADESTDASSPFRIRLAGQHFDRNQERERRVALAALRGACWIIASALVLIAATVATLSVTTAAPSQLGRFGGQLKPPSGTADLAQFYSPVLRLAQGEQWRAADPTVVLEGRFVQQPAPPESCSTSSKAPCGTVVIANEPAEARTPALIPRPGVFSGGYVYPHVVDTSTASQSFAASSIPGQTAKVIEYWIYYAGDNWTTPSAIGRITQGHDGDWEWVGIGLDPNNNPLFVAYSAHCGGSWRPWNATLAVAETPDGTGLVLPGTADSTPLGSLGTGQQPTPQLSHPLVAVGLGSHANYPTSAVRSPDWIGCTKVGGIPGAAIEGLSYIANIRETISDFGSTQIPVAAPPEDPNLTLPLYWGNADIKTVDGYELPPAGGPASPIYHPEFDAPLQTIFNRRTTQGRAVDTHWSCDQRLETCAATP